MDSVKLGEIQIFRVVEMEIPFLPPQDLFTNVSPREVAEACRAISPGSFCDRTGKLNFSFHSFLVKTPNSTLLIDTCIGCDKSDDWFPDWYQRRDSSWLDRLHACDVKEDDIDYVLCTHLHLDHVGWNTRLVDGKWQPTFLNARYLFSKLDIEHYTQNRSINFEENVQPVIDSGQAMFVDSDFVMDEYVRLSPSHGHTPGHVTVHLSSGEQHAVMFGDVMHTPAQCTHPQWHFASDWNPEMAQQTREGFLEEHADRETLILTGHFPSPSIGHIKTAERNYRFFYLEETRDV
ncbi:MAG: MBL fold metallo-hydrolase [Pseudomonadota bacterium]